MEDFILFLMVGFVAQLVDGALGMAYGVVSASMLMTVGVPPANVSASVHASKVFTGRRRPSPISCTATSRGCCCFRSPSEG